VNEGFYLYLFLSFQTELKDVKVVSHQEVTPSL